MTWFAVFRIMAVVLVQALVVEEDMIIIQDQVALIIEILVQVIIMVEVDRICQSQTTPEITVNMVVETQEVVEEDFQGADQVETITFLEVPKLIEIIVVVAHHREATIKVVMGNMVQEEAISHGLQTQGLPMVEVDHQVIVDQADVDHQVVVAQQGVVSHYWATVQVQVTVECKTLPIGVAVARVLLGLPYSVNLQI